MKQEPQKVIFLPQQYGIWYKCPNCGNIKQFCAKKPDSCENCGQVFDWFEMEE